MTNYIPEWVPEEAREPGAEWEHSEHSVVFGSVYYYYCDDCEKFHQEWLIPAFKVENGTFYVGDYTVDTDGNWDFGGWEKIETEEAHDKYDRERYEELEYGEMEYLAEIALTGEDYLNYFYTRYGRSVTEKWQVRLKNSIVGPILRDGRRNGRGKFLLPDELPKEVLDYLMVGRRGEHFVAGYALGGEPVESPMRLKDVLACDGFKEQRLVRPQDSGCFHAKGIIEIERYRGRKDSTVKQELRRKARKQMHRLKKL